MFQYEGGRTTADFVKFLNEKAGTQRLPGGKLSDQVSNFPCVYNVLLHELLYIPYFLESRCTSKSHHPQNLAAYFSQLIPINAALEISLHGTGSTTIYVCARTLYVQRYMYWEVTDAVYARACHINLCRRHP